MAAVKLNPLMITLSMEEEFDEKRLTILLLRFFFLDVGGKKTSIQILSPITSLIWHASRFSSSFDFRVSTSRPHSLIRLHLLIFILLNILL